MSGRGGTVVLMGSGELTSTMVEVHKQALAERGPDAVAVFLDTPAGFQLNVDQISERAVHYFRTRVARRLAVASYPGADRITPREAEEAYRLLRAADYVLIGPGSPTYTVRQLAGTPVPDILVRRIESGGCLVAASAAALTVGRRTLPVYEIYKVGADLHWADGMNLLAPFGLDLTVVPHWNNAEGGTHDTRFCYMGEPRFRALEAMLPGDRAVLGLDEHTACILDLESGTFTVRGIGRVTLRREGRETVFGKGQAYGMETLRGGQATPGTPGPPAKAAPATAVPAEAGSFWPRVHGLQAAFEAGLGGGDPGAAVDALLELDRALWQALRDRESDEFISQGREILRELIVAMGTRLDAAPASPEAILEPLTTELIGLRERYRREGRWEDADAIRDGLERAGIQVDDTPEGTRWRRKP